MKVIDLFESTFSVEHKTGSIKRAHDMSLAKVNDSIMFSHAEKKRIGKLEVGQTCTTQRSNIQGRTVVRVTRKD